MNIYKKFMESKINNLKITLFSENVLMVYFDELSFNYLISNRTFATGITKNIVYGIQA